ncbi:acetyltransferase [Calidifontibacillus erzurumensis]|uniref:Acetyltransferase n=1 Tax=Calidifontibacillus erzurumensis TaxID=2741433 RepID=A0A8J8KD54_9BACI|nr:acetyltransferase [Calidifontibacillus erzurumensis]NSL52673.1 acetyltransferase [Calidifontibacillus erzurumensis]
MKVVIWGCGGHGREVLHLCEQIGIEVVGFLDERPEFKGKVIDDIPVLGDLPDILHLQNKVKVVCAGVGSPQLKKRFVEKTKHYGFEFSDPLVHPSVYISKRNQIGIGTIICEGTIITTNVIIKDFVIINRRVNISHDDRIENFVTISPGVNLAGNVTIMEGAYVGIGSSIREKITIGPWAVIGGGAFVKEDVPGHTLYAGVPARFKKYLESWDTDGKTVS